MVASPQPQHTIGPPPLDAPHADWARAYCQDFGLALTSLPPGAKGPDTVGWNETENTIRTPDRAADYWRQFPERGMGAVHRASGTATFDVDDDPHTALVCATLNLDREQLLAPAARTTGHPQRDKGWYRAPSGLALPPLKLQWPHPTLPDKPYVVFELRAGPVQDVLPPSLYPGTGHPYRWLVSPWELGDFPPMPTALLDLWQRWDALLPAMEACCPWEAPPSQRPPSRNGQRASTRAADDEWDQVRAVIRERLPLQTLLAEMGAEPCGHGKYLCVFHNEQHPSFWVFDTDAGYSLWTCGHGTAPVGVQTKRGYSVGDVIDLYAYRHQCTVGQATTRLAMEYNIPLPKWPELTWDIPTNGNGHGGDVPPPNGQGDSAPAKQRFACTDMGNAERFVAQHAANVRYCAPWNSWLLWDEKRWRVDTTHQVVKLAKQTVRTIYREAADAESKEERRELAAWARRSEAEGKINAMLSLARPEVAIEPGDLDRDPWLLCVANGVIDLRWGDLRPHRREDYITKLINVEYDPEALCPLWDTFLERVQQPEPPVRDFLQRAVGYSATGSARERRLIIVFGRGKNGKGVFLQTVRQLLGEYAVRTPSTTFLARRDDSIPNDVAQLRGARFVFASETNENRRLAEATIKDLTGGEDISARFMRAEWFSFTPTFTPWLATNHKPVIKGTDEAIWDRIALVPFTVRIPEAEQDPELVEKLRAEYAGILAWIVRGAQAWYEQGLGEPVAIKNATKDYHDEMDTLGDFLDEHCILDPQAWVTASDLYQRYKDWCEACGEKELSQKALGLRLLDRGFHSIRAGKNGARAWQGLRLRDSDDSPQADASERPTRSDASFSMTGRNPFHEGVNRKNASERVSQDNASADGGVQRLHFCPGCEKPIPLQWERCATCDPDWRAKLPSKPALDLCDTCGKPLATAELVRCSACAGWA